MFSGLELGFLIAVTFGGQIVPSAVTLVAGSGQIVASVEREPYRPGQAVVVYLESPNTEGRTEDGYVVSGFSIYAWRVGARATVVVLIGLPGKGKDNSFCSILTGCKPLSDLAFRELARYTMDVGEMKPVSEMKSLGLRPLPLRLR